MSALRARIGPSLAALILIAVLAGSASAQTAGSATNVNDCTLINDPVELRNCILRFEGQRTPPPTILESAGPTPAADTPALGSEGQAAPRRSERKRASPAVPAPPPRSADTPVAIEQIEVPRAGRR